MTEPLPATRPREIWTRLTVDPLAMPLAEWLAKKPGVTPNRVTFVAIGLAIASAVCMATGNLRIGGVLFLARFFVDCMDGRVARVQGGGSKQGAALDLMADIGGIALVTACLGWWLVENVGTGPWIPIALLANLIVYNWLLEHRKQLAAQAGLGLGGADHTGVPAVPVVGAWFRWCRRLNMSPVPWSLEAEILALGLAPLVFGADELVGYVMAGVAGFFVMANVVNIRRLWKIAAVLDEADQARKDAFRG